MIVLISTLLICWTFIFGLIASELDTFYFLSEKLLRHPMYRDRITIFISTFVRLLLMVPPIIEYFRCLTLMIIIAVISLDSLVDVITALGKYVINVNGHHNIYIKLTLILQLSQKTRCKTIWVACSCMFWGIVVLSWAVIKGPRYLPSVMVYLFRSELVVVLVGCGLILPKVVQIIVAIFNAGNAHKKQAKLIFYTCKTKDTKIAMLKANAVCPIKTTYGPFWTIDNEFLMLFFYLIILRVFEFLIIVDFER